MPWRRRWLPLLLFAGIFVVANLGARYAKAAGPAPLGAGDYVAVETIAAAYTVFVGIPKGRVESIRAALVGEHGVELVEWVQFQAHLGEYVKARIVKDEHPGSRAVPGVVALVKKYPLTPIGLTWNGGVAITRNDYEYAKRSYRRYKADPAVYERTRNRDPRADPVNPQWHLGPLLGW